jgi:hypothetical protein
MDLNSGLHACKAGALLLEPRLQSILLWLFWSWGLVNYLPGLAIPPSSDSQVTRITSMHHWSLACYITC